MADCTGCSGSNGPDQSSLGGAGANEGPSASDIASNLADAATGPMGLEPGRYAAHVDAAMDAARAGYLGAVNAADIEAAAMDLMNPREQAQFQNAMDAYRSNASVSLNQQIAMDMPFRVPTGEPPVCTPQDPYGLQVPSEFPTTYVREWTAADQARAQEVANAHRNVELITSGPFSGLFAAGGVIFGAEQHVIEGLALTGQMIDGFTSPLGPSPQDAMRP